MCVRVCRSHAKKTVTDSLEMIKGFKFTVALPAPSLYAQFKKIRDVNLILTAVKKIGFDDVFEVSKAAEFVTAATRKIISEGNLKKPVISSACPAVIKLITMRFPSLIDNILPVISPMELAAIFVKKYLVKNKGLKYSDIGVFFISPCAAKRTNTINPLGIQKSAVDGVIGISDVYMAILDKATKIKQEDVEILTSSTSRGINWALIGGESSTLGVDNAISVDGMENVIEILENLENGQIHDVEFIEALACIGGCVGGPLTLENSFFAKNILKKTQRYTAMSEADRFRKFDFDIDESDYKFCKPIEEVNFLELDDDLSVALKKLQMMNDIYQKLPMIDCGSCGAPTCRALAEDVVRGSANIEDCIFMLRQQVKNLAKSMVELTSKMPQTIKGEEHNANSFEGE
jgi:iron only hydrogenase large subunit-like protein